MRRQIGTFESPPGSLPRSLKILLPPFSKMHSYVFSSEVGFVLVRVGGGRCGVPWSRGKLSLVLFAFSKIIRFYPFFTELRDLLRSWMDRVVLGSMSFLQLPRMIVAKQVGDHDINGLLACTMNTKFRVMAANFVEYLSHALSLSQFL